LQGVLLLAKMRWKWWINKLVGCFFIFYIICPHTAIGYAGYKYIDNLYPELRAKYLIVCTSNPIKFKEIIAKVLPNETIPIPIQLKPFLDKKTIFESIPNDYNYFKTVFLNNCNT
jgi:threonine synthase